jgi:hypothetical protein
MLREAIVCVSIAEVNLSSTVAVSSHLSRGHSYHLRLERVHIEKPIIQLQGREFRRWGKHRI